MWSVGIEEHGSRTGLQSYWGWIWESSAYRRTVGIELSSISLKRQVAKASALLIIVLDSFCRKVSILELVWESSDIRKPESLGKEENGGEQLTTPDEPAALSNLLLPLIHFQLASLLSSRTHSPSGSWNAPFFALESIRMPVFSHLATRWLPIS